MKTRLLSVASFVLCLHVFASFICRPPSLELPEDLMYQGEPIHPCCVVNTQFGDSSRLDPKPVFPLSSDSDYVAYLNNPLQTTEYNKETNSVASMVNYVNDFSTEHVIFESYRYAGTYKNRHIVEVDHYDTSGTGRFMVLGLVVRVGDTLINDGEITGGDRSHGGCIRVESLEGSLLRYNQNFLLRDLMRLVGGLSFRQKDVSTIGWTCFVTFEVDLEDPSLEPHVCGIKFSEYDYLEPPPSLESDEDCFAAMACQYIRHGKIALDLDEAKTFAYDVVALIQESVPAAECEEQQNSLQQ